MGLVLVLVMGPSSVSWARPVSTFEVSYTVSGSGGWMGYLTVTTDENGIADVDLSMSRMGPVTCPNGVPGFAVESMVYRGVGFGTVAVERKMASLQYAADVPAVHTLVDGCGGETVNTGATLTVGTVATGDLQRGRTGDTRVLSRLSQVTVGAGPAAGSGAGLVSEIISRG
jgi:hypothetical protein